jgi:hypothetical protein
MEQQVAVAVDDGQEVVEVVGQAGAAGQLLLGEPGRLSKT